MIAMVARTRQPAIRADVSLLAGRALAFALHPVAAWYARPASRVPLVAGYVVGGYVVALLILLAS